MIDYLTASLTRTNANVKAIQGRLEGLQGAIEEEQNARIRLREALLQHREEEQAARKTLDAKIDEISSQLRVRLRLGAVIKGLIAFAVGTAAGAAPDGNSLAKLLEALAGSLQ